MAELLQAEILLRDGQNDAAASLLSREPPQTQQFRATTARYKYLLGYLALNRQGPEAEPLFNEAIALGSAAQAWDVVLESQARLGQVLFVSHKDRVGATAVLHQAYDLAAKRDEAYYQTIAANGLGMTSLKSLRYDEAIPWFKRITQTAKTGGRRLEIAALQNLAICYFELGSFDEAFTAQRDAINLVSPTTFAPIRMELLGGMGNMYLRDDTPKAIGYYQRALALAKDKLDLARWRRIIAAAYISIHDWDSAEQYNNQAIADQADDDSGVWAEKNSAAIAAGRGRLDEAKKLYKQLLADAPDSPEIEWEAHAALGDIFVQSRDYPAANSEFAKAIAIINQSTDNVSIQEYKLTLFANLITFYRNYVRALIAQGKFEDALAVADSSRARILAQRLALGRPSRLMSAQQYVDIARETGSVLLFYWVAPEHSYLWVVTPAGIQRPIELPEAGQIRQWVDKYRAFVETQLGDPMASANETGRGIYDALIAPAARWIPPGSRVILIPDDALHWLNFETLPVYGASPATPHFWIEDVRLTIAPSLAAIGRVKRQSPHAAPTSLLIMGDPNPAGDEYPKLAYASQEIQAIKARLPGVKTREFTKTMAVPGAYRSASPGGFSLLHFSTHAVANKESPLDSAIILSPEGGSFKLYARDIMEVPLSADLVTISACRSAGARTYSGEGLVGFAWAFLQAGARNVIAGLWDVTDSSTPEIMATLYSQLAAGKNPDDALREAKLKLIHSSRPYHKPYYWGPFQLYSR